MIGKATTSISKINDRLAHECIRVLFIQVVLEDPNTAPHYSMPLLGLERVVKAIVGRVVNDWLVRQHK